MGIFNIFNTKKCKTVNAATPEVKENPNKYIPKIRKEEEDVDENKKTCEDKLGRELRYKIDIFATPVLNSLRKSDKSEQRTLSKGSVDNLCEDFEKLLTTKTASESETESESVTEEEDEKKSAPQELEDTGRVDGTTFNYRTNKSYKVKRSARIAKKY